MTLLVSDVVVDSIIYFEKHLELDPVGSTVRYEVMKLCAGSIKDSNSWYTGNWWY